MGINRHKAGILAVIVASALVSAWMVHRSNVRAVELAGTLREQCDQIARLQEKQKQLSALAMASSANTRDDLLRLRDEVARLKQQTNEITGLRAEAYELHTAVQKARSGLHDPQVQGTERTEASKAKTTYVSHLAKAMRDFAAKHKDEYPTDISDLKPFLPAGAQTKFNLDDFEIVYRGSTRSATVYANPFAVLLIREKTPWQNADGKWVKVYATLGSIDVLSVADNNFEAWEKEHIAEPQAAKP